MADGNHYRHVPFLIEMYKSWNKMHDTATDGAIDMHSYCIDDAYPIHGPGGTLRSLVEYNARLGRCQYGVSFEGEEIGTDKTIIAGRKGLIPFDLNVTGYKSGTSPSALLLFVRADYILYVRPDLVVTILGQ